MKKDKLKSEKETVIKDEKKTASFFLKLKSRVFRKGGFMALVCIGAVLLAVLINVCFGLLPTGVKSIDLTTQKIYTLSQYTEDLITQNDKDVTFYFIAQSGSEDVFIKELLSQYQKDGKNITIKNIDPIKNPTFISSFTSSSLDNNSVIVQCGNRVKVLNNSDIYVTTTDYTTYQQTTSFDGEAQLTSAFNYVTDEFTPVVYTLTGHGEYTIGTGLSAMISKENIQLTALDLLTLGKVPQDAAAVIINSCETDISQEEAELLKSYLNNGGNIFLASDYIAGGFKNLQSIAADFGIQAYDSVVIEGDSNYYLSGYPLYMLPSLSQHQTLQALSQNGSRCMLAVAQGLYWDAVSDVTVSALFTTSDSSYARADTSNLESLEKISTDEAGPFTVGVAAQKTIGDKNSKLIWITTSSILDDSIDQMVSGGNSDFVLNAINWMTGKENRISIHSKSLYSESLTISEGQAGRWSTILLFILPLIVIVAGVMAYIWRRKK